jgi:hypothetical protein
VKKQLPPSLQDSDAVRYTLAYLGMNPPPAAADKHGDGHGSVRAADWKFAMASIAGTGHVPLSYSGNPGVNGVSHRGGLAGHCWPTYISGHLGMLSALWTQATYARYAAEQGLEASKLTPLQVGQPE